MCVHEAHSEIPWPRTQALRNRLIHDYFSVDPKIVLDTVHNDLAPLVGPLKQLLGSLDLP